MEDWGKPSWGGRSWKLTPGEDVHFDIYFVSRRCPQPPSRQSPLTPVEAGASIIHEQNQRLRQGGLIDVGASCVMEKKR